MTGSQKSLAKGSPAPGPVPEGIIRLYSMRFCPFAQRPRLVLVAKGIKHEVININLKNKPEWLFEKNPFGLVPILETSKGEIIYESTVVCDYLDEVYPGKKLTPEDPYQKALQKMTLERFSGVLPTFYKIVNANKVNQDITELKGELVGKLEKLGETLAKGNTAFFGGDSVSMIDYMIWPWFERIVAFDMKEAITGALGKWYENMLQDPAVKETFTEPDLFRGFFKLYNEDSVDAVDYGL
ncbi:glutathione S-transferase omega-1 [Spea bombifrons]|uniref:glutathione S-transferase omega-1 n=1 Tax=Spea bombifrons TaxID=233779 RepID=UPI00234A545B|nr:glutathione S-transferase omega-1 [Spea bombifrons]